MFLVSFCIPQCVCLHPMFLVSFCIPTREVFDFRHIMFNIDFSHKEGGDSFVLALSQFSHYIMFK